MKIAVVQYIINAAVVLALWACRRLADALVVLVLGAVSLLMLPDLWCVVFHARTLMEVAQAWRASGPHNTVLGRLRELLAAAGLIAAPRDPLAVCGVPIGEGWRHLVRLMFLPEGRLACMEQQVLLAREEHRAFTAVLLLAAACLSLLSLCLMGWACTGRRLAQRRHQPPDARDDLPTGDEGGTQEVEVNPHSHAEGEEVLPAEEEVEDAPLPSEAGDNDSPEEHGRLAAQEAAHGAEARSQTPPDPRCEGLTHEGRRDAGRVVRHSLHVPPYLRERLAGPKGCFLEYLRRRHSVVIFMDAARRRMHVKGAEEDVVLCCGAVKVLLEELRRRHAAGEE